MTEDWKRSVDKEIRICNAFRVLFDERTKQQQKELDEGKKERLELYDYKNDIYRKLTFMKANQIDPKEFRTLSKCVNTLKTEKKFLPWLGVIISVIVGLCMIFTIITSRKAEGASLQSFFSISDFGMRISDFDRHKLRKLNTNSFVSIRVISTANDRAQTVRRLVKVINDDETTQKLGFRFACKNPASDRPILDMYTLRSREECLAKQPQLEYLASAISITWDRVTGNKVIYVYDNNNLLIYTIDNKGNFIVVGNNLS